MKVNWKNEYKKFDIQNHIIAKLQSKFTLKSSILSNEIKIEDLNLAFRKNSSDAEVIYQIWVQEEYKKPLEIIKQNIELANKPIIFDIGANIGMASLYFKHKLPLASIYCFEPFKVNRVRIPNQFNVSPKALWKKDTKLEASLNFRDGKEWSVVVMETPEGNIQGAQLSTLMNDFKINSIDILKVDVEGSEYPAFLEDKSIEETLAHVKSIVIEIHDDAGNRNDLYTKLKKCNFINYPLGELDVFINSKLSFVK